MKKFRLLLLDANVVIHLFELGIWEDVIQRCDVHLAGTVIGEASDYIDAEGDRQEIDLEPYVAGKKITRFDLETGQMDRFKENFGITYLEQMDPGETESLAYLLGAGPECKICSADKIVFRVLGALRRSDQALSLEEILQEIGLGRRLPRQFTRAYRDEWVRKGFQEGIRGIGLRE